MATPRKTYVWTADGVIEKPSPYYRVMSLDYTQADIDWIHQFIFDGKRELNTGMAPHYLVDSRMTPDEMVLASNLTGAHVRITNLKP